LNDWLQIFAAVCLDPSKLSDFSGHLPPAHARVHPCMFTLNKVSQIIFFGEFPTGPFQAVLHQLQEGLGVGRREINSLDFRI